MKFKVTVEKSMHCSGVLEVESETAETALEDVQHNIDHGQLQTTDVQWDDPEYEDTTFTTTGDVEEA